MARERAEKRDRPEKRDRDKGDRDRLNTPGRESSRFPRIRMDGDTFGEFAEAFARFMGTAGFLMWMTIIIILWIAWNTLAPESVRFDPFPFIFLTLVLSLQASYAAPLILLAQNRQEARDRISVEDDRRQAAQSRADMDFLAREIASVRMNVGELATRDYIRSELRKELRELLAEHDEPAAGPERGSVGG
ncbi:hypothetical protein CGZ98_16910 [Enemella evansiae]|uniref:DUF1003 domain-containing protein n=1 Tax=Enemella evansiae TaxID=2016499 RepID=UPI000B95FFD3|nr:DUF1003 domain-containing protein [Enemella evansiae]OYO08225.1 hypothetical protein CGZ98_16910 [Enemella evansiae]OYO18973.1 hypothetical protein BI335_05720 [Enemella evansiae]